jgi:hypothetical protein
MRQHWSLPDEEQFRSFVPSDLLLWVDQLGTDAGVQLLLLLWRKWHV